MFRKPAPPGLGLLPKYDRELSDGRLVCSKEVEGVGNSRTVADPATGPSAARDRRQALFRLLTKATHKRRIDRCIQR